MSWIGVIPYARLIHRMDDRFDEKRKKMLVNFVSVELFCLLMLLSCNLLLSMFELEVLHCCIVDKISRQKHEM